MPYFSCTTLPLERGSWCCRKHAAAHRNARPAFGVTRFQYFTSHCRASRVRSPCQLVTGDSALTSTSGTRRAVGGQVTSRVRLVGSSRRGRRRRRAAGACCSSVPWAQCHEPLYGWSILVAMSVATAGGGALVRVMDASCAQVPHAPRWPRAYSHPPLRVVGARLEATGEGSHFRGEPRGRARSPRRLRPRKIFTAG